MNLPRRLPPPAVYWHDSTLWAAIAFAAVHVIIWLCKLSAVLLQLARRSLARRAAALKASNSNSSSTGTGSTGTAVAVRKSSSNGNSNGYGNGFANGNANGHAASATAGATAHAAVNNGTVQAH